MVFLCCASCDDSRPPAGILNRKEWINENSSHINHLIRSFKALSIEKLVWSDTGFVTLIDLQGCVREGKSVSDLLDQNQCGHLACRAEDIEGLMEAAKAFGVNGMSFSVYLYVDFKDGYGLVIDERESLKDERRLASDKQVLQVRPGWYLFFGN